MFDPYHKWLGIPKDQRPPTYYQLLGIAPTESDTEVIEDAAVRQSAHVRNYQVGPHAQDATRLLNELSQAKVTLLNPAKRKAYEEQLAQKNGEQVSAKAPRVTPSQNASDVDFGDIATPRPAQKEVNIARPARGGADPLVIGLAGGVVVVLLVLAATLWILFRSDEPRPAPLVQKAAERIVQPPDKQNVHEPKPEPPMPKPPDKIEEPKVAPVPVQKQPNGVRSFKVPEDHLRFVSLSPDGTKLAVGGIRARVYELATGLELAALPSTGQGGHIRTPVLFHPDSKRVAYAYGSDRVAHLADALTGKQIARFDHPSAQYVAGMAFSPDGKRLLISCNWLVYLWEVETLKELKEWKGMFPTPRWRVGTMDALAFTADGRKAITGAYQGVICWWDLEKLNDSFDSLVVTRNITTLSLAKDERHVAVGGDEGMAIVNNATKQIRRTMVNDPNAFAVAFCGGGSMLLTGGKDGIVRLYDVETLKMLAAWPGHSGAIVQLAVDPQEQFAVSAERGGTVFVWPLSKDAKNFAAAP